MLYNYLATVQLKSTIIIIKKESRGERYQRPRVRQCLVVV
jgi:hypothetical protein